MHFLKIHSANINVRVSNRGVYSDGSYVTLPARIAHLSFVAIGNYIFIEGIEGLENECFIIV